MRRVGQEAVRDPRVVNQAAAKAVANTAAAAKVEAKAAVKVEVDPLRIRPEKTSPFQFRPGFHSGR